MKEIIWSVIKQSGWKKQEKTRKCNKHAKNNTTARLAQLLKNISAENFQMLWNFNKVTQSFKANHNKRQLKSHTGEDF